MFSLKNLNSARIKFRGPVLSQLRVYLISRSFQKIAKFKSVCECVCAYMHVCINVTNQNNVTVATCKTQYRVLLFGI